MSLLKLSIRLFLVGCLLLYPKQVLAEETTPAKIVAESAQCRIIETEGNNPEAALLIPIQGTEGIEISQTLEENDSLTTTDTEKRNVVNRLLDYYRNSNQQDTDKKVDFGIIPGPHYSSTAGLGLGILGIATYSTDMADKSLPRSNASVAFDMTTKGFFLVGIFGNHIWPHEKFRLDYKATLSTFNTQFWGIGYDNGDEDDNETDYRRNRATAFARFMMKIANDTYLGASVNYRFFQARGVDIDKRYLWAGQDRTLNATTVGLSFTYDSRDFILNASRGWYFQLDQTFTPDFLGSGHYGFSTTEFSCATYRNVWKNGILCGEVHGQFNYGDTPWPLLAEVGSSSRMRGYYEGRYRDKNLVEGQIELRQFIKGRSGIAIWLAAAQVFPRFKDMRLNHTLPNGGVGYRWEFKKRINVRIDYGLTRNGSGVTFCLYEAF